MGEVECDDGNKYDGDGCTAACKVEPFWVCYGGSSISPDICQLQVKTMRLTDCLNIANLFQNTCEDLVPVDLKVMQYEEHSCDLVGHCPGTLTGGGTLCTW